MSEKPNKSDLQGLESSELTKIIKDRAYKLWEADGSPESGLNEYWHRARELIEDEAESSYPPAASRGHRG